VINKKNDYLNKKKLTILDDTKYKEFQIECLGTTTDFQRSYFVKLQKRRDRGGVSVYRYAPDSKNNTLTREFKFPNEAGTSIVNEHLKIIKP